MQVGHLINNLTNDEDLQQELWVHYLSGNSVESLSSRLESVKIEYSDDLKLIEAIWLLIYSPPSNTLIDILDNFSDFEKSIMCLLMLGISVERISAIKGINEVRIRQSISSIKYNTIWREKYGAEERF